MKNLSEVHVGVDISKNNLDIFVYPIGKRFSIENSKDEIDKFAKQLAEYKVLKIACEATGGYEKQLQQSLSKHSYHVWVIDPRRIKGFIIASGCKSKTDKIDAQKIAEFSAKNTSSYEPIVKTENQSKLQALSNRKGDLLKFLVAEKTRLQHPSHVLSIANIKKVIAFLEKEIKSIDLLVQEQIKQDVDLSVKSTYLESIPGIGKASAAVLLSFVPELGKLSNKQIAAITGLCPYDHSSGKYNGKKFIRGGRIVPRNALYMCALSAIKHYLPLKTFYNRLIANNKPFKVAIVAVMHKLIIIANTILRKEVLCHRVG